MRQQLRGELERVVEGRVQSCRVLTVRNSEVDVNTRLAIETA